MSVPPSPDIFPAMPAHLPLSPNDPYFEALDYDYEEEPYEDLVGDYEEDPDEDSEMDMDIDNMYGDGEDPYDEPEMGMYIEELGEPMVVLSLSPLTSPPPISPNSSEPNHTTPTQFPKSTYEVGGAPTFAPMFVNSSQYEIYSLKRSLNVTQHKVQSMALQMDDYVSKVNSAKMDAMKARQDLYWFKLDMSYVRRDLTHVGDIVLNPLTGLEDVKDKLTLVERTQNQDATQIHELRNRLSTSEIRLDVANFDRYQLKNEMCGMQSQMRTIQQRLNQRNVKEHRPNESVDVLATYGDNDPSGLQQPSNQC